MGQALRQAAHVRHCHPKQPHRSVPSTEHLLLMQGYCGMDPVPLLAGQLDSIKDVSTAVSNALNPFALGAAGGGANASDIVAAAAPLLGPQVGVEGFHCVLGVQGRGAHMWLVAQGVTATCDMPGVGSARLLCPHRLALPCAEGAAGL